MRAYRDRGDDRTDEPSHRDRPGSAKQRLSVQRGCRALSTARPGDVAVFRRYVLVVMQTLTRTPLPDLFSAAGNDGVRNNNFAPVIQSIIEPMLNEMHAEQALAIAAVDTPAEIWRLGQTCNGQL